MLKRFWFVPLFVIAACGEDTIEPPPPPPPEPTVIEVVSAVPSTGTVGDVVPLIVRTRTPTNKNVPNKTVTFRVLTGGGSVTPATVTSDSSGRASTNWTLGTAPGSNSLTAGVDSAAAVVTIVTQAAPASRITLERGNNQTAEVATALRDSVIVRVTDRFNNPRSGITVSFSTADGGIIAASATTDAAGRAGTTWVLGSRAGTQRLTARADTATVQATATATAGAAVTGQIVVPATVTAGDSVVLQFRTVDRFGNETTGRPTTFTVNNPNVGTVSGSVLRTQTAGTLQITATADQATATATLNVQPFRWSRINSGDRHTCGIAVVDSRTYCWGAGGTGALGHGGTSDALMPTAVSGSRTFTRIAAGLGFTCAVGADQLTYCWGANEAGQVGNASVSTVPVTSPAQVAVNSTFSDVTTGRLGGCALATGGRPICWGGGSITLADFSNGVVFTQIAGAPGGGHACGLDTQNFAWCWGRNNWGQLGNSLTTDSNVPVQVFGDRFATIAVGDNHTCGITLNGATFCWGAATLGQTGTPILAPATAYQTCPGGGICRTRPVALETQVGLVSLDAYGDSTCGINGNNEVYCWGIDNGNLGNDVANSGDCSSLCDPTPTQVQTALRITQVTVGGTHSCAIINTGDVYCWGQNNFGQLGRNKRAADATPQLTPVPVFAPRR